MSKGPILNNAERNFTTRDSLGIEGVATSISAELCPIINTVTPRAFYWPFMVWIYYDFIEYSGIQERNEKSFNEYVKKQDYFFVLANLLVDAPDQFNLVGKQQTQEDIRKNEAGPYPYNKDYFKTRFGGMLYYNAGCLSMGFVTDHNPENLNETYSFPKMTPIGKKMALAFESIIKNTTYYKDYRLKDIAVPREVLIEYGKVINIGLVGFDDCKAILKKRLFQDNPRLPKCSEYIKYLWQNHNYTELNGEKCRKAFYDRIDNDGKKIDLPEELLDVSYGWEIVVGRQYFTMGLEMIWKYMLEQLEAPLTKEKWISNTLDMSVFKNELGMQLDTVIQNSHLGFREFEKVIGDARRSLNGKCSLENGLEVILSIYNRFIGRDEINQEKEFFTYGSGGENIPFAELFETVNEYRNRPLKDFILFIMDKWLIQQHYFTAYNKMLQGRDGFYYEMIENVYIKKYDFGMDFQGIRMIQVSQVMKDLGML